MKAKDMPGKLKRSPLEVTLAWFMDAAGLTYTSEYRFDPVRRWRLDFAFTEQKLAIEVEGGIWSGGRHTRGAGFEADIEKYNALTLAGWRLLRFSGKTIKTGEAILTIQRALSEA